MDHDLLHLFARASAWTASMVPGATERMDAPTPCDDWAVRDLRATDQDPAMPTGLPEAAYDLIHGAFTGEQRAGLFDPEVDPGPDPSAQDRLLAYTGRTPG